APAALDDLGDTGNLDNRLLQVQSVRINSRHVFPRALEVQAGLARSLSQRGDTAMVDVAPAVEDHALDAQGLGAAGNELADGAGLAHTAVLRDTLERLGQILRLRCPGQLREERGELV